MSTLSETAIKSGDLLNRLVLDYKTTEKVGRVKQLWLDVKTHQVTGLTCASGMLGREQHSFSWDKIETIGKDSILVNLEEQEEVEQPELIDRVIGLEVWTDGGNKAGPMKGKTIARWGKRRWQIECFFKTVKYRFSLHRFGQKTLLGVYRWLILSFIAYLLAHWVYLHLGQIDNLDWFDSAQNALILLLPHILLLSLLNQLQIVIPWLNERGFDFCLMRCKI